MNVEIRGLEEALVNNLNASRVPTEVKRLVVMEILMKLEAQVEREIALEMQALNHSEEENTEKEN